MRTALWLSLWRQRLTSPVRMVVLAALVFMPLLLVAAMPGVGFAPLGDVQGIVLLFAAGLIGQDVSTGVLQLLLARPVRRWEYVIHRWLAAAVAATAMCWVQALVAWGLMNLRGGAPPIEALLLFIAGRFLDVFALAAVITLLSSLIGGLGDLAIYLLFTIALGILGAVAQTAGWQTLVPVIQIASDFVNPKFEMAQIRAGAPSWYAMASYLSTVSLALWLAVVSVNRKELSYASS